MPEREHKKHHTEDYKLSAVKYYLESSRNKTATCRIFKCSERSLQRWIDRYHETSSIKRHNRPDVSYKVTRQQVEYAIQYMRDHKTISMNELHAAVQEAFPDLSITPRQLANVIRDANMTRKRTRHGHFPQTRYRRPVVRRRELEAFYRDISAHDINKIISIDETSLTPFMYKAYSRCEMGSRCIETTDNNKVFTKHTFVVAITSRQTLGWKLYDEGAITTERLLDFLRELIATHRLRGYLFLLDNAGAHKNASVSRLLQESGNSLRYTVPYNPQTNAVENLFSQFKHYMKTSKVRTVSQLRDDIRSALRKITPENYMHYFTYAYNKSIYNTGSARRRSSRWRRNKTYKEANV